MGCQCDCGTNECQCGHDGCDCGEHGGFERRFATKEEQVEELGYYLGELKKEVQAVEERIADLKK